LNRNVKTGVLMELQEIDKLVLLVDELRKLPTEKSWLEFKKDNYKPEMIGEDISALANAAVLADRNCAYMLWGVDDSTHEIVGTEFDLQTLKKGNEELENWLRHSLSENAYFVFHSIDCQGKKVGILKINAAALRPVSFDKTPYVRIGSYTKKLRDYPEVEANLWDVLRNVNFEKQLAKTDMSLDNALNLLDVGAYFDKTHARMPSSFEEMGVMLCSEGVLSRQDNGLYSITNMGAILFAKRLSLFERLSRKAVRVIQYRGINKLNMMREMTGAHGYAVGFDGLIQYLMAITPSDIPIEGGSRATKTAYPEIAIRELVANALIHQDFSKTGTGPLIEVFDNRIEISSPGNCLVEINRLVDSPPKSRNEQIAALSRRMKICEEAGGGWDKAVIACEQLHLPAPKANPYEESFKVTLRSMIPFSDLSLEDKLWTCYLHACIKFIQGEHMTNASLRERFALEEHSSASISRAIKRCMAAKLVKPLDPTTAPKYMKYVPYWA